MLGCLVGLIIAVIVALIVLWVFETIITSFGISPPSQIMLLVRLLVALIVLIYALQCLGLIGAGGMPLWRMRE